MSKYIYKVSDSYFIKNNNGSMKIWSTGQSVGDNQSYTLSNITISGSLLASATTSYNYVNCGTNTASSLGSYTISISGLESIDNATGLQISWIPLDSGQYSYYSIVNPGTTGITPITKILRSEPNVSNVTGETISGDSYTQTNIPLSNVVGSTGSVTLSYSGNNNTITYNHASLSGLDYSTASGGLGSCRVTYSNLYNNLTRAKITARLINSQNTGNWSPWITFDGPSQCSSNMFTKPLCINVNHPAYSWSFDGTNIYFAPNSNRTYVNGNGTALCAYTGPIDYVGGQVYYWKWNTTGWVGPTFFSALGDVNAGELYGAKPSDGLYYFVPYFAFIDTDISEYVYFSGTDPTITIFSGMNPAEVTQILCFNDGGIISVSGNTVTGPIWQEVDVNNQPI